MKEFFHLARSPMLKRLIKVLKFFIEKFDTITSEVNPLIHASEFDKLKGENLKLKNHLERINSLTSKMENKNNALRNSIKEIEIALESEDLKSAIDGARKRWNQNLPLDADGGWRSEDYLVFRTIGEIDLLAPKDRNSVTGIAPWFVIEHCHGQPMRLVQVALRCGNHVVKGIIQ